MKKMCKNANRRSEKKMRENQIFSTNSLKLADKPINK